MSLAFNNSSNLLSPSKIKRTKSKKNKRNKKAISQDSEIFDLADVSVTNNAVYRFENKMKCLNSVFSTVQEAINLKERTLLVLNKNEDLEFINAQIVKNKLAPLSLVINPKEETLHTSTIQKLNGLQKLTNDSKDFLANEEKINEINSTLVSYLNVMRTPKLANFSIIEIQERIKLNQLSTGLVDLDLFRLIPFDNYKAKKTIVRQASQVYKPEFYFLSTSNPLNDQVVKQYTLESITIMFTESIEVIQNVLNKLSLKAKSIEKDDLVVHQEYLNKLKLSLIEVCSFKVKEKLSAEEQVQFDYYAKNLAKQMDFKIDPSLGHKSLIKEMESAFNSFVIKSNVEYKKKLNALLNRITIHSSTMDLRNVFAEVKTKFSKIKALAFLKNWQDMNAVSLAGHILMCEDLLFQLEFAQNFADSNSEYIEWLIYFNDLEAFDQNLIKGFLHIKSDWIESFEFSYLQGFVNDEVSTLNDISQIYDELFECLNEREKSFHTSIHSKYQKTMNTEIIEESKSSSWQSLFEEKGATLTEKFPLIIVNGASYERYINALNGNIDKIIFVNYLPDVIPQEVWNQNILAGYIPEFVNYAVKHIKRMDECEVFNIKGTEYKINRPLNQMNSIELNMVSLYLGQALKEINPDFKIFQLRSKTIISFMNDDKNATLLKSISNWGAKEIFSKEKDYNLLPSALSDSKNEIVILIEDGLLSTKPMDVISHQFKLLREIKTAGINTISINNHKWISDDNYDLHQLLKEQLSFDSGQLVIA